MLIIFSLIYIGLFLLHNSIIFLLRGYLVERFNYKQKEITN